MAIVVGNYWKTLMEMKNSFNDRENKNRGQLMVLMGIQRELQKQHNSLKVSYFMAVVTIALIFASSSMYLYLFDEFFETEIKLKRHSLQFLNAQCNRARNSISATEGDLWQI